MGESCESRKKRKEGDNRNESCEDTEGGLRSALPASRRGKRKKKSSLYAEHLLHPIAPRRNGEKVRWSDGTTGKKEKGESRELGVKTAVKRIYLERASSFLGMRFKQEKKKGNA